MTKQSALDDRIDALVLSGEPDRRSCCYYLFGIGSSDGVAASASGSSRAEVAGFRAGMPANWSTMGESYIRLDGTQVMEIRNRHLSGERIQSLARHYRVSRSTVSDIVHKKAWKQL